MSYDPNPEETSLAIPAEHPTMNELMSRRPLWPRKDIEVLVRMQRAECLNWGDARDQRRDRKEDRGDE